MYAIPLAALLLLVACAGVPATAPASLDAAGCVPFDEIRSYAVVAPGQIHLLDAQGRATHALTSPEAARAGLRNAGSGRRVALAFPSGMVCPGDGRDVRMTVDDTPVAVLSVEIRAACPMPDARSVLGHAPLAWCLDRGRAAPNF